LRNQKKRKRRSASAKRAALGAPRVRLPLSKSDQAAGRWFAKLVALQERLCAPNGCPWDREQTHTSLRKYLIEETYEVLEAMESGDMTDFAGELGDLLLQIVFHSVLAEGTGSFTISDVIESIYTKMVRRHPHVFANAKAENPGAVLKKWEEIKAQERAAKRGGDSDKQTHESVLSGVPQSLPAVLEAYQLTRRASHIGFDWHNLQGIFDKIDEEKRELAELTATKASQASSRKSRNTLAAGAEEEVGDLLFAAVNVARFLGVDAEIALKKANSKFKSRFQWMESAAVNKNQKLADIPRDEMEKLWDAAKEAERTA
jgi:tetrapyrrole methylase family protein/MazG family protein